MSDTDYDERFAEILGDEATDEADEYAVGIDDRDALPHDVAFDLALLEHAGDSVLGTEPVSPIAPAAIDYLERRAAADAPTLAVVRKPQKLRDWQIDFGPVWAPAGAQTTITARPQCLFRGEKIIATDTASNPGAGTRIVAVTIGQLIQRPASGGSTLTKFFAPEALANGITFDTAQPYLDVQVTVSFVQSCTFSMTVFGSAVVDE